MQTRIVDDNTQTIEKSKKTPFLALTIPVAKPLHRRILAVQEELSKIDPRQVHHVPEYFHVTVKPLGWLSEDVEEKDLPTVFEIIERGLSSFKPFDTTLAGLGYFAEVVYLKVKDSRGSIVSMNRVLLAKLGRLAVHYAYEGHNFVPHVTIASFATRDVRNLLEKVNEKADFIVGQMRVSKIDCVRFYPHLAYGSKLNKKRALRRLRSFALSTASPCAGSRGATARLPSGDDRSDNCLRPRQSANCRRRILAHSSK